MIGNLDQFLATNDCLSSPDFEMCYLHTRLLLIGTTKELDASNDRINGLNEVVDRLIGNINAIIDNFDDGSTEKTKLSLKLVK
ncbi:lambda Rz1-like protein [Klebsiella phage N1M2]|uniref:Lambda Rz1-like protein n=1 Tax=Klebsiella phage N1M2 TaxID=2664939 RepID=A0A6B7ZEY6_9CAUD|nr:lambda Rz1-like protein [Klebsiella phage N1M2]QGH71975.1 lambda Rz1-like protein [Klebsiella phage N1M2]